VRQRVALIPVERRLLITAHDAFNYFGRAYGVEVMGLQGISTASEAGTGDVQRLVEVIVRRRIPAIFVESSIPLRTIQAVQAAVRARGFAVAIGGSLYSDALGDPGGPAGTYTGMVRTNVETIVRALSRQPVAGAAASSDQRGQAARSRQEKNSNNEI
jgi:manganese/zinc/iron transport system substrate-binding protein